MGDMKLLAEDFGLPPSATGDEIVSKAKSLAEENRTLAEQRDMWRIEAEKKQVELAEAQKVVRSVREQEGARLVDRGIADQKIDKSERDFFINMYREHPDQVSKLLNERSYRQYLARDMRMQGNLKIGPTNENPMDELKAKVAEKLANDTSRTLSEAAAQAEVLREDPTLYERTRQFELGQGAKKGGDE
jgi:hypothetical protein